MSQFGKPGPEKKLIIELRNFLYSESSYFDRLRKSQYGWLGQGQLCTPTAQRRDEDGTRPCHVCDPILPAPALPQPGISLCHHHLRYPSRALA